MSDSGGIDFQYPSEAISGSLTGSGQASAAIMLPVRFSLSIGGTFNATVLLERSPDGGVTYYPCSTDATGTPAAYTTPISVDVNSGLHPQLYRLRCTAYSTGTINYVMWQ